MTTIQEEQTVQQHPPTDQSAPAPTNGAHTGGTLAAIQEDEESFEVVVHMPDPSIWPLVIATGTAIVMLGIVLGLWILFAGIAMLVIGIGGWLYQDIQVARRSEHH
jgi:CBS domain containing-hemolysin-like protein